LRMINSLILIRISFEIDIVSLIIDILFIYHKNLLI
jgi:hypothetical protein